jgi:membrane protein YdbS with pleckstrin-like domain
VSAVWSGHDQRQNRPNMRDNCTAQTAGTVDRGEREMELKVAAAVVWIVAVIYTLQWCFWCMNQPSNVLVVVGGVGIMATVLINMFMLRIRIKRAAEVTPKEGTEE